MKAGGAAVAFPPLPDPRFLGPLRLRFGARPRRAEKGLPQEGANPERDAGAPSKP